MRLHTEIQKDIILLIILLFFIVCFFFWYMKEGFDSVTDLTPEQMLQVHTSVRGSSNLSGLMIFDGRWNNSTHNNDIIKINWSDLQFSGNKIRNPSKNKEFTLSFWFFLSTPSAQLNQTIFRIVDSNNIKNTPRILLNGMNMQIEQPTYTMQTVSVTPQAVMFITVVFTANDYSVYNNGILRITEKWPVSSMPSSLQSPANAYILLGTSKINNYVMRDIQIYDEIFTATSVLNLYTTALKKIGNMAEATQSAMELTISKPNQSSIKYVRIQHQTNYLHVQEIEVYDETGVNIAGKSTISTSTAVWGGTPEIVINGRNDAAEGWPNSNHTLNNGNEFIELDLNEKVDVSTVIIYNRPDCCQERLVGAQLILFDENRVQVGQTIILTGDRKQKFDMSGFTSFSNFTF